MNSYIEKIYPCEINNKAEDSHIFLRLNLEHALSYRAHLTPMIFAPAKNNIYSFDDHVVKAVQEEHISAAKHLAQQGFFRLVLAANDDGFIQKMLSPRYNKKALHERMNMLIALYEDLRIIIKDLWVSLTIEELAPGGFDPYEGIVVAQELERLGLKNLIVSAGTRDFLPLYDRRPTQQKDSSSHFYSREPFLASTLWPLEHTNLNLWALGYFDDYDQASLIAKKLGLAGIIDKKVR
jgi:hypothetical protein